MKFRSMILVLTIAFSVIFMSMIGSSYAYYLSFNGTSLDVTTGNIDTNVAVIFDQSQYINVSTGVPLTDDVVDTLANASTFTMTPNNEILSGDDVAVAIKISLVDITIDDDLRIEDFKYKLSCTGLSEDLVNGTGLDFTDDVVSSQTLELGTLSTTDGTFDVNSSSTCTLRVWLRDNGENQNDLMDKKFMGLIKVNTLFKK